MKDPGLPALGKGNCVLHPPKLAGTWAYREVVLNVASMPRRSRASASSVHPITYAPPRLPMASGEIPALATTRSTSGTSPHSR